MKTECRWSRNTTLISRWYLTLPSRHCCCWNLQCSLLRTTTHNILLVNKVPVEIFNMTFCRPASNQTVLSNVIGRIPHPWYVLWFSRRCAGKTKINCQLSVDNIEQGFEQRYSQCKRCYGFWQSHNSLDQREYQGCYNYQFELVRPVNHSFSHYVVCTNMSWSGNSKWVKNNGSNWKSLWCRLTCPDTER